MTLCSPEKRVRAGRLLARHPRRSGGLAPSACRSCPDRAWPRQPEAGYGVKGLAHSRVLFCSLPDSGLPRGGHIMVLPAAPGRWAGRPGRAAGATARAQGLWGQFEVSPSIWGPESCLWLVPQRSYSVPLTCPRRPTGQRPGGGSGQAPASGVFSPQAEALWATCSFPAHVQLAFFCFFRAARAAYGSSQARGRTGAGLHPPQPQQRRIQASSATCTTAHGQHQIPNPLSEARD